MNFQEMVDSVVQITKRPERVPQIQLALAKATIKFHAADFWMQDRMEIRIAPAAIDGQRVELMISSQLPGFRKLSYLYGYDDQTDPTMPRVMNQFQEREPVDIRDGYGIRQLDVCYQAGDTITCWCSAVPPKFLVGYYALPNVSPDKYKSWIATMLGYVIVDEACVEIFGSIGDADEAARRKRMFPENLAIVRTNSIMLFADGGKEPRL